MEVSLTAIIAGSEITNFWGAVLEGYDDCTRDPSLRLKDGCGRDDAGSRGRARRVA
jgi:hypothetical protein